MDYFKKLGTLVQQRWQSANYREAQFPRIAYEALRDEPVHAAIDAMDPIRWLMGQAMDVPRQVDLEGKFGQPPLVTFYSERFFIHVLYWLDSTTDVHQHSFGGAFQVVGGSSLHSQFTFDVDERVNNQFQLGRLRHRSSELLHRGDTRPIQPNHGFIHSLFHLDRPSISVVVRTLSDPGAEPQYSYSRGGVALDPFFKDPVTVRQVQAVRMLGSLNHPEFSKLVLQLLARADLPAVNVLLHEVLDHEKHLDALSPYLDVVRNRFGARVDVLESVLQTTLRERLIVSTRTKVQDADLRFFLALLLNVDRQELVFEMVKARFPGQEPRELILKWLGVLASDPVVENNPLGFQLDETSLLVAQCELEGLSHEELLRRFEQTFDPAEVAEQSGDLAECSKMLRTSPLLRPLFHA